MGNNGSSACTSAVAEITIPFRLEDAALRASAGFVRRELSAFANEKRLLVGAAGLFAFGVASIAELRDRVVAIELDLVLDRLLFDHARVRATARVVRDHLVGGAA